jgi:hypothetical protein
MLVSSLPLGPPTRTWMLPTIRAGLLIDTVTLVTPVPKFIRGYSIYGLFLNVPATGVLPEFETGAGELDTVGGNVATGPIATGGEVDAPPTFGGGEPALGGVDVVPPVAGGVDVAPPELGGVDVVPPVLGGVDVEPPVVGGVVVVPPVLGGVDELPPVVGGVVVVPPLLGGVVVPPLGGVVVPPEAGGVWPVENPALM